MSMTVRSSMPGYPRNRLTDRSTAAPVVTRTTLSRGYAISYDDAGAGPAILLIPGSTMSAADWRDAGYLDQLVGSHRVLSIDPLGNGLSDKPHDPDAYRWPDVAADLIAVLDAAGVDQAVAWGYSRGGGLAGALAVEFPERVSGIVLQDGGPINVAQGGPVSELGDLHHRLWPQRHEPDLGCLFVFARGSRVRRRVQRHPGSRSDGDR